MLSALPDVLNNTDSISSIGLWFYVLLDAPAKKVFRLRKMSCSANAATGELPTSNGADSKGSFLDIHRRCVGQVPSRLFLHFTAKSVLRLPCVPTPYSIPNYLRVLSGALAFQLLV